MFEKLKKRNIMKSLLSVILLVGIGIALIAVEFSNFKSLMNGHVKFESLAPEEINEDLIVDASITANFGAFIEEYEENTKTHVTRTTSLYYIIWTGDEDAEDFRYMGIKVPVADESAMEAMAEASYYGEYSDPIEYSGAINKMTDEEYGYFKDCFLESGFTEEEIEDYTLPYYIHVGALTGGAAVSVYVIFGIGVLLVLIGLIRLAMALSGSGLKTIKKELAAAGFAESDAEYEYESAKAFDKKGDIRIGRRITFFMIGSKPHAIANEKIVWAYQNTTTHRTNGIKTGTTYAVALNTYEKKTYQIAVDKESVAQEILQYMNETMPWAVVGYNDDIKKLYNKDYQGFLDLRYNQARQEQI